jgi:hypothetical protein
LEGKNEYDSILLYKATTKSFTGPKKGRCFEVDAEVLHFFKEMHAMGIPITQQTVQVKAAGTARITWNKF